MAPNMQTVTLTLNQQELAVISKALMLAPYGEVAPVINSINQQIQVAQAAQVPKEIQ